MPVLSEHARAQLLRFARLTVAALLGEYWRTGGNLPMTWSTLWVLAPGAVETVLREVKRVKPVAASPGTTATG